jgi:hypothetical protein
MKPDASATTISCFPSWSMSPTSIIRMFDRGLTVPGPTCALNSGFPSSL